MIELTIMTSLFETFTSQRLEKLPRWRYNLSLACLVIGSIGAVVSVIAASTNILMMIFGITFEQSWEVAGVLGGLGTFLLLSSIPYSTPRVKDEVLTMVEYGSIFVSIGTLLFVYQYPQNWNIFTWETIALVLLLYLVGLGITLSAALRAVIGFEVRKTPGGEIKLSVESDGDEITTQVQESTLQDETHYMVKDAIDNLEDVETNTNGSIGLIGGRPDEFVDTQTNRPDKKSVVNDD